MKEIHTTIKRKKECCFTMELYMVMVKESINVDSLLNVEILKDQ